MFRSFSDHRSYSDSLNFDSVVGLPSGVLVDSPSSFALSCVSCIFSLSSTRVNWVYTKEHLQRPTLHVCIECLAAQWVTRTNCVGTRVPVPGDRPEKFSFGGVSLVHRVPSGAELPNYRSKISPARHPKFFELGYPLSVHHLEALAT